MGQWKFKPPLGLMQLSFFLAGFFFIGYLSEILFITDQEQRMAATDVTTVVVDLLAVIALFLATRQCYKISRRLGLAWMIILLAQCSYLIGDSIWATLEVGLGLAPFPSAADGFYLVYYPLILTGILVMPVKSLTSKEWTRKLLDNAMVMVAAVLVFWNFIIGPYASLNAGEPVLAFALSLAYPCGDLLILAGLLVLIYHYAHNNLHSRMSLSFIWLSLGMLCTIVTDSMFSIQTLMGTYVSGGLMDIGWAVSYLLTAIAGFRQVAVLRHGAGPKKNIISFLSSASILQKLTGALPYIAMVSAFILLILRHDIAMPMDFLSIAAGVGLIIALVLVRQMIVIVENSQLVRRLNLALCEVQQQSSALEKSNLELQEEITERERVERQLAHDAMHDSLTGLPNRALFLNRLEHAINYGKRHKDYRCSVLFLDLDYFKVINDSLGHSIGDHLLVALGQRLSANLRSRDTIARLGGDEFVILLEDIRNEDALLKTAEHIQSIINIPFQLKGYSVFTSASIGIIGSIDSYALPEEVLRDADIAMYSAKSKGKACQVTFNPELRKKAVARLELENEMHRAIEYGEFVLYYQPIFSLATGSLAGFEALIRWDHPSQGLLMPGKFLDIAEESGLILPIGEWVLNQACSQMQAWQQLSPEAEKLTISINISSKQFAQAAFAESVTSALRETGLDPNSLNLEITENVIIHNPAAANQAFLKLAKMGIHFHVDDFGTGYSSLSQLQHFPFQGIKIDRTFIHGISRSGKNANLVRTVVRMAHDLGMEAVAEGIETEEQKEFLQSLDCQFGQGFLLSEPLDEMDARTLIQENAFVRV